jgi:hypothetical protein
VDTAIQRAFGLEPALAVAAVLRAKAQQRAADAPRADPAAIAAAAASCAELGTSGRPPRPITSRRWEGVAAASGAARPPSAERAWAAAPAAGGEAQLPHQRGSTALVGGSEAGLLRVRLGGGVGLEPATSP